MNTPPTRIMPPPLPPRPVSPHPAALFLRRAKRQPALWIALGLVALCLFSTIFGITHALSHSPASSIQQQKRHPPSVSRTTPPTKQPTATFQPSPTVQATPPPNLTIDTTSLDPNASDCSSNGDGTYDCTVTLGEDSSGALYWSASDNLGASISPRNGTISTSTAQPSVTISSLPCQDGTITFRPADSARISVSWSCSQPTPTPTSTPTPVPTTPPIIQLKSSYAGSVIASNGAQVPMNLYIDSEDQRGNLSARVFYSTSPITQFRCTGKVGSDNVINLSCIEAPAGYSLLLYGHVQQDGSITGTDSAQGRWTVY